MGDIPTEVNQVAQTFDDILSGAALNILLPIADKAAEAQLPFLAFPVLKQMFEFGMSKIAGLILTAAAQTGVKIIITIQTDIEKSTYSNAEGALRAALLTNDPIKIATAKANFEKSADSLIHWDGSVTAP